ncbi:MAG: GAF domain-containing sensor histidine kinase [Ferruginibacter sp.]
MQVDNSAILKQEEDRIRSLKKYDILDTPPDGSFDRITRLAAKLLGVPIAIVTLVDTDRIWFKSKYGIDVQQITRDPGLCSSAILSNELYIVEDARKDPRTLANPLIAGEFGLQFYAAAPLRVKGGHNLGTLCVIDKNPRKLTPENQEILQSLADILIDQIELRLAARLAVSKQNQVLNMAAHDLKNPLTIIPLFADMIKHETDREKIATMCDKIEHTSARMLRMVNELLESASTEANEIQLNLKPINVADLVAAVIARNKILADKKNQQIKFLTDEQLIVYADENKFTEIVDNLINNAIKYSPENTGIYVTSKEADGRIILEVRDEGQGFTPGEKVNLFQRFSRLSSQPTGGETATGLGLSIVKTLVEAHEGTITAESEGKDMGSKFIVSLPLPTTPQPAAKGSGK